jgi:ketosteroid isomerase-like protein
MREGAKYVKTESLRINQLSPEAYEWYLAYLEAVDSKNLAAYGPLLADSCTMITNNGPAVVGKEAILQALAQYWQSFGSLEHDLLNIYGTDTAFMLEALNHYVRHDGVEVTLRAVALTDRDASGLATAVRLYTDASPLFS